MSDVYPNAHLTESGISFGDIHIPAQWIESDPKISSESGFFHRISLTVFVEEIHIGPGVTFS